MLLLFFIAVVVAAAVAVFLQQKMKTSYVTLFATFSHFLL